MSEYLNERRQWFLSMVGKTIYRTKTSCNCKSCEDVYKHGLAISDDFHAIYLCDIESSYNLDGVKLKYFENIEERDKFENN